MRKFLLLVIAAYAANLMTYAQTCLDDALAYRVKNEAFNNSKIEDLSQFMTDDLGPCLAASKMKLRAEKMVINKLEELGLSNPRAEFAFEFAKGGWDNEKNYVAMTAPYYCSFVANPKAWSGSTDGLVKGECVVIDVKEKAELEKAPRPANACRYTMPSNWQAMRELQNAIDKMLREELVLAVVSGSGTFNVPSSRGVQYKQGDPEPTPEIVLPIEDHGRMVHMLNKGQKVEMELDVKNGFTNNPQINNVIAEIPGSGRFCGIYLKENDLTVPFFEVWKKPLESLGFRTLSLRKTGGTDHLSFTRIGLPAYQFIQDELEYGRTYHTTMDTYERLSLDDLKVDAAITVWLVLNASMNGVRIPAKPGYPENIPATPCGNKQYVKHKTIQS